MSLLATKGSMLREKQVKAKKFSTKCKMPCDKVGPCLVVLFSSRWLPGLFVFYVASSGSKIFYSKFYSLFTPFVIDRLINKCAGQIWDLILMIS